MAPPYVPSRNLLLRTVTSRTVPDSYQWSMSPSNRMADIMDEKVLPSMTTFRGVLTRMLLAPGIRFSQPSAHMMSLPFSNA